MFCALKLSLTLSFVPGRRTGASLNNLTSWGYNLQFEHSFATCGARGAYGGEERRIQGFGGGHLRERATWET